MSRATQIVFAGHEIKDPELYVDSKEKVSKRPIPNGKKLKIAKFMFDFYFEAEKNISERQRRIMNYELFKGQTFNSSKELFDHIFTLTDYLYDGNFSHSYGSMNSMINLIILVKLLYSNIESNEN